jgi:murein DD-endopeptidase MepM/ murein hydrolase activator NlpD
MKWARHPRTRILLVFLAIMVAIATLVARLSRISRDGRRNVLTWSRSHPQINSAPKESSSGQSQDNSANVFSAPPSSPNATGPSPGSNSPQTLPGAREGPANLIVPVAGVRPDQLRDTFSEARSEGRIHDAIDIPAPRGTPVLAAADGSILKLFQSERGGTTIYQLSTDGKFVYYYAHLDLYAEGLTEGHLAKQGETIAYVGDSGNAGAGNYHLHFSIAVISDPKRYWQGVNINPYPLLRK